jgi:hypothetical protein
VDSRIRQLRGDPTMDAGPPASAAVGPIAGARPAELVVRKRTFNAYITMMGEGSAEDELNAQRDLAFPSLE